MSVMSLSNYSRCLFFLIPVVLATILSLWKFQVAQDVGFVLDLSQADSSYGVLDDGFVILYNDEITYLSWLDRRADSFVRSIGGDGDLTLNVFGYLVGSIYYMLGETWQYVFILGIVGFYFFMFSCMSLLKTLKVEPAYSKALLMAICLSPTVINLTSGMMRDLFVLSAFNYSLVSMMKGRYFRFIVLFIMMVSLRTYMSVILFPLYVFFYFNAENTSVKLTATLTAFFVSFIVVISSLESQAGGYPTGINDVFFRLLSAIFGLNIVVLDIFDYFSVSGVAMLEKLSHAYQFLVMLFMYYLVIKCRFRFHAFFAPFLCVSILLSVLYGFYLGYFVARTKLLVLWLALVFIGLQLSKYGHGSSKLSVGKQQKKSH